MRRAAIALTTDFDAPEIVSEVYAPEPLTDGDGEFIDMIEEERCAKSPDGTHTYIRSNCCSYCATPAPWIRRDTCPQDW